MGLFSFISFLIVTSLGTLYPIYLSYKAIKANDLQSLEVLLMYWIVMGSVTALENTFGWLINWLPFYYEAKTVLMLWLTLPQIQGSTFVYVTYLHPFLLEHEADIDAIMVEAKEKAKRAGADYLRRLVEKMKELVMGVVASQQSINQSQTNQSQVMNNNMPMDHHPASIYAMNFLRQFGPAAAAVFQPMQTRTHNQSQHDFEHPPGAVYNQLFFRPSSVQPQALSGYQIPEYDAASSSLGVPGMVKNGGSGTRRVSSPLPSPGRVIQASSRMHHSNSGSGLSAYDEILQDEASGSETEWMASNRSNRRNAPRASTGQMVDESRPLIERSTPPPPTSSSSSSTVANPSGPGWWFGWGGRPIEEMSKKKD